MKTFKTSFNVGKSKYVVSFSDGVKTHGDGSAFFDIAVFGNKKAFSKFCKGLISLGYLEK